MSIKTNAEQIRDETLTGANTAARVGGNLVEIADDLIAKQIDIDSNTAKTGITISQSDAIVANTTKVGITTSQASDIVTNTAKVGISTGQASAITANTAKVGITDSAQTIAGVKTFTATLIAPTLLINKSVGNGTDKLEVNGNALIQGAFKINSGDNQALFNGINFILMQTEYENTRLLSAGKDKNTFFNSYKGFAMFINSNSTSNDGNGNVIIFSGTNNGIDKLQVNGSATVTTLKTSGFTVATLPSPPLQGLGARAHVTDALNPTYLGTLTGGGTVKCPVFYNGTAWVSA